MANSSAADRPSSPLAALLPIAIPVGLFLIWFVFFRVTPKDEPVSVPQTPPDEVVANPDEYNLPKGKPGNPNPTNPNPTNPVAAGQHEEDQPSYDLQDVREYLIKLGDWRQLSVNDKAMDWSFLGNACNNGDCAEVERYLRRLLPKLSNAGKCRLLAWSKACCPEVFQKILDDPAMAIDCLGSAFQPANPN